MELTLDQALQKGIEAHKAGNVQEADGYYTAILKANPKHPDANHNMGVLAVGVGKVTEALPFFKAALEANASIAQYWLSYIDALIKLERLVDAKVVFDQAKQKGAKGDGFDDLERRLVSSGTTQSDVQEPPQNQTQPLVNLYRQGQYQEALNQASQLLLEFPRSVTLYNIIGAVNQAIGKLPEAIEALKEAISLKPNYGALNNLGNILKDQGKLDDALKSYNKAISLKPDYPDAHYNMGNALQEQGEMEEAIEAYNKALSLKPDYVDAQNNMGNALKNQGKFEEAIEAYKKALSLNSDNIEAHYNMGNAFREQGKLKKAVEAYKKAISIKPDNAMAYNNMGYAFSEQGRLKEAIEAYKTALSIKPDYAEAYWNLHGSSESINQAKRWIKKCLEVNPNHINAKLIKYALQFYEGKKSEFSELKRSPMKDHPYVRSFNWAFNLPELPQLYFHRGAVFDYVIDISNKNRPFYEFGVWRGEAFRYFIKTFKKGYGFDTFEGIPEDWHDEKTGTYSSDGNIPQIEGGEFIIGKFEDTLPGFFSEPRPKASIINFDADLYSSTICALNFSKPVIDKHTILIFDEFIINKNWEQDEYKALEEFCSNNNYTYEVLAISFFTKQVAVRIIGI